MARPNAAIVSSIEERECEKCGKKGNEISLHSQNTKYTNNVQCTMYDQKCNVEENIK